MQPTLNFSAFNRELSFADYAKRYRLRVGLVGLAIVGALLATLLLGFEALFNLLIAASFVAALVWADFTNKQRVGVLQGFANDNGFSYTARPDLKALVGIYRLVGHSHRVANGLRGQLMGLPFGAYDYSYTIGSGKSAKTTEMTVLEVQLSKDLPHIFLDSSNEALDGKVLRGDQRLKLSLEFDKIFKLYGSKEHEIETLTIINPLLMQRLIDYASTYDIEIEGRRLIVYQHGIMRTAGNYQQLFEMALWLRANIEHVARNFKFSEIKYAPVGLQQNKLNVLNGQFLSANASIIIGSVVFLVLVVYAIFETLRSGF